MAAPLRKIVGREKRRIGTSWTGRPIEIEREVLDCGHRIEPRKDIYGETNAYRRRCEWCQRYGAPESPDDDRSARDGQEPR